MSEVPGQQATREGRSTPDLFVAAIGQVAAILVIVSAAVYSAGALSLAFKLWYDDIPLLPVLVQLPRSWSISQAVTQLLPAAFLAGIIAVFTWNRIRRFRISRLIVTPPDGERNWSIAVWRWLVSIALAAIFTGITLLLVRFSWFVPVPVNAPSFPNGQEAIRGIYPRPWWNVAVICFVLDTLALRVGLSLISADLRRSRFLRSVPRDTLRVAVLTLFFTPIAASTISAANPLPIAKLCGPAFSTVGSNGRYTIGGLIGISGQYAYLAEVLTTEPKLANFKFASGYVAVIPLSEANLISIGVNARCYQLAAANQHG